MIPKRDVFAFLGMDRKLVLFCFGFLLFFSFPPAIVLGALGFFIWKPSLEDNLVFIKCILPLIGLLMIGLLMAFFSNYDVRDKLRDIYYFGLFFSALYMGVRLTSFLPNVKSFIILSVVFFTVENVLYLKDLVFEFQNFENINKLRDALGQRSTLPAIVYFPFLIILPSLLKKIFLVSTFLSFLNFSRTNILTGLYFYINLNIKKKIIFSVMFAFMIPLLLSFVGSTLIQSYIDKTEKTFAELFSKQIDTTEDLNEKWRAYERFIVNREMETEDFLGLAFGKGLGATAYSDFPKRTDATSTEYIVEIPVFHDSTLFIKLKMGYFGLAIWYVFWMLVFVGLWSVSNKMEALGFVKSRLILFLSFVSVLVIFIFSHGYPLMRNPHYISVVVGYFLGLKNKEYLLR